jgi:IS30 family transposase
MSYRHLTTEERVQLGLLKELGWSTREIAKKLERHHSTIAREWKRNGKATYHAREAQEAYQNRRKELGYKGKATSTLQEFVEQKLELSWSPEQIAGYLITQEELPKVSFKTIYRWLYLGIVSKGNLLVLRQKGKRRKPKETRGRFNIGKSIRQRPKEVRKRETFGHWELDTVVSRRGKSKGCFATFAERKTRQYLAIKFQIEHQLP